MRAVTLLLASCLGLALAGDFIGKPHLQKLADKDFLVKQKQVFNLFYHPLQTSEVPEIKEYAKEFSINKYENNFTNVHAVKEFWRMYQHGMLPKGKIFSVFYDQMREEAIALFHVFYYAKDFETFYKSAAWAREHINEGMFLYAFSVAVLHREDCRGMILPAPYEIYPYYFVDSSVINKMHRIKMQEGIVDTKLAEDNGITYADNYYTFYANYTGWYTRYNKEQKISYFTEDIGLNAYYYYFHADYPFWMGGEKYGLNKDRRGETYYYFHQQLLARYYWERLTNELGEIPTFSWDMPVETGYYPSLKYSNGLSFPMRQNYYEMNVQDNTFDLEFIKDFETIIRSVISIGYYRTPEGKIYDLRSEQGIEYLANFIQYNPDFFGGKYSGHYQKYYELIARMVLGASTQPINDYYVAPSVLENFQTSLRDPTFWQLYKRIVHYFLIFKQYLQPYTKEQLYYPGVKVESVEVDKLVTYFDYYDWVVNSAIFYTKDEISKPKDPNTFLVRQPRLNNKPFSVKINIMSEKEAESVVRIFMAPKYDSYGKYLTYDENKNNFVELDSFLYKLTVGKNTIVRKAEEFFHVVEDRSCSYILYNKFKAAIKGGEFHLDMSEAHNGFPRRLLLPKGTKGGFPFQLFVIVSPHVVPSVPYGTGYETAYCSGVGTGARYLDARPFGYPFDRPIDEAYFYQPNMYTEDVLIFHNGSDNVYEYAKPSYFNGDWYGKDTYKFRHSHQA